MSKYAELVAMHRALQEQLAARPEDVEIEHVLRLIVQVREAGTTIGNPQEREQLRAILRHWGAFVYERTGEYPATQLAPLEAGRVRREVRGVSPAFPRWLIYLLLGLVAVGAVAGVTAVVVGVLAFPPPTPVIEEVTYQTQKVVTVPLSPSPTPTRGPMIVPSTPTVTPTPLPPVPTDTPRPPEPCGTRCRWSRLRS